MTVQPVHDQGDEDLAEDEAAFAAATRGEYVSHEAVRRWLASKDTDAPLPRPVVGD